MIACDVQKKGHRTLSRTVHDWKQTPTAVSDLTQALVKRHDVKVRVETPR